MTVYPRSLTTEHLQISLKRRFGVLHSPDHFSFMILNIAIIINMTQSPPPFCITLVPAGDVGGWRLNSSHAALIPCSCEIAAKSIRLYPSSLHYNTHHCIGMYWIIMNESLSAWQEGRKKRTKTWYNINGSFRGSEWKHELREIGDGEMQRQEVR